MSSDLVEKLEQIVTVRWGSLLPSETATIMKAAVALEARDKEIARLQELVKGPLSWLERWAEHKGSCLGASEVCTCGLALARHELRQALKEPTQ